MISFQSDTYHTFLDKYKFETLRYNHLIVVKYSNNKIIRLFRSIVITIKGQKMIKWDDFVPTNDQDYKTK